MYFFGKKMHQPVQNCCPIVAIERILSANAVDDAEMVRLTRHPNELWCQKISHYLTTNLPSDPFGKRLLSAPPGL